LMHGELSHSSISVMYDASAGGGIGERLAAVIQAIRNLIDDHSLPLPVSQKSPVNPEVHVHV
jgi:hypothetical protein